MSHWKLTVTYDGGHFHGWQVQPGLCTVQGTLAEAVAQVTGETVLPQGSGRTDAGVHALAQVTSFSLKSNIPEQNFVRALNQVLPRPVRVVAGEIVPASFHARHSARRKTYEYRIFERKVRSAAGQAAVERLCSPFLAPYVWDCRWPLALDRMNEAAAHLLGTHDFTSLAASDPERSAREDGGSGVNPVKTIFASAWHRDHDLLVYRVTGTGFLHHMVRNIVGTMVDIGRGSLPAGAIPGILTARDRAAAGPTAPAHGLFLVGVAYDEESI